MTIEMQGLASPSTSAHAAGHQTEDMNCAECAGFVQVYKWRISAAMARDLLLCHQRNGTGRFFLPVLREELSSDFLRLQHWGLIAACPDAEQCWNVTLAGEQWLLGQTEVPACALFYNGCLVKMTVEDRIGVTGVLGKRFVYPLES